MCIRDRNRIEQFITNYNLLKEQQETDEFKQEAILDVYKRQMERNVAFALASVAGTISKLAFDACMFNSQNFGFVKLPDEDVYKRQIEHVAIVHNGRVDHAGTRCVVHRVSQACPAFAVQ